MKGVPIVPLSGLTGRGLDKLVEAIAATYAVWNTRIPTNPLNRYLQESDRFASAAGSVRTPGEDPLHDAAQGPPAELRPVLLAPRGAAGKLSALHHQRFAEAFSLPGVPIRLTLREKGNPYADKDK